MAGVEIRGEERSLQKIFCDDYVFQIPPYQRPYSWTTDEAGQMLEDLVDALGEDGAVDADPYFLGSIVLAKEKDDPDADVIDGQQRLTTLTLLLASLTETLPGSQADEVWEFIRQKGLGIVGQADVPRVSLRPRDRKFFRKYVQEKGGLPQLLQLDPDQLSDPERNIRENAALLVDELRELETEQRTRLVQYLLTRCYLVVVSTPDRDSAYRVFKVLNDRGMDLSHTDILKSEVIGRIGGEQQQEEYTDRWENAEEELGRDQFEDLFAHIRMIFAKTKQQTTVLDEFRTYVVDQIGDPASVVDDVIVPYADRYADILNMSLASIAESERINTTLRWLHRLDNVDWIPPALAFVRRHKEKPKAIADFLESLERLAASMFIRRVYVGGRIKRYGRLLKEIEADADLHVGGGALDLTASEKAETIDRLAGQVYDVRRTRQYILLRLDAALSEGTAVYDYKTITVEHVLPQRPRADSTWVEDFDEDERIFWTHRLANLVLLSRRKNSDAQNYDFTKKREKYFKSEKHGVSPFALTTEVINQEAWTPSVLEARQQRLVSELAELWRLGEGPEIPSSPEDLDSFDSDAE